MAIENNGHTVTKSIPMLTMEGIKAVVTKPSRTGWFKTCQTVTAADWHNFGIKNGTPIRREKEKRGKRARGAGEERPERLS